MTHSLLFFSFLFFLLFFPVTFAATVLAAMAPSYIEMTEQRAIFDRSWGVGDPEHLRPVGCFNSGLFASPSYNLQNLTSFCKRVSRLALDLPSPFLKSNVQRHRSVNRSLLCELTTTMIVDDVNVMSNVGV